jgi:hypothetical protein
MNAEVSRALPGGRDSAKTGNQWFAVAVATFLSASVAPVVLLCVLLAIAGRQDTEQVLPVFYISLLVSLAWVVMLGLPAFFLLRFLRKERISTLLAAGLVTGGLPLAILGWPLDPDSKSSFSTTWHGEFVDMVKDGVPTLYGWLSYLEGVTVTGVLGAISAATFWYVWVYFNRRPEPAGGLSGDGSKTPIPDQVK